MQRGIITLADHCEASGLPRSAMIDLIRIINANERAQMRALAARQRAGTRRVMLRPLRLGGRDLGRVTAEIDARVFARLVKQKNFGWAGLRSAEGRKELVKAGLATPVETVSGKTQVGYTGPSHAFGYTGNRKIVKRY